MRWRSGGLGHRGRVIAIGDALVRNGIMSCRFARATEDGTVCDLLTRGGWQQLAALEQLRAAGVSVIDESPLCPVAARGQWLRCPCRRAVTTAPLAAVRL